MSKFSFNEETCIGCGVCVRICPKGLIRMDTDGPKMDEASAKRCNNCGQCVAFCPAKSAMQEFSRGVELEDALAYSSERGPTILKFLKSRRSERIYQPDPVPHETLMRILETANFAPSGGNNRTIRWVVLENPAKTAELREMIAEWFDTVCRTHPVYSKRYAIDSILERFRGGKDVILRGAPHVAYVIGPEKAVWGSVDTGIALAYFNLACEALDVGCCFAGYATKAAEWDKVADFIGVKPGEKVWCAICFGKKAMHAVRIPNRGKVPLTLL